MNKRALYSQIPAIDGLLHETPVAALTEQYGQTCIVSVLREMQDDARDAIRERQQLPDWHGCWADELSRRLDSEREALRPVINLTGTVLHTNLGRALQAEAAIEAVTNAMRWPVTLEYSLDDAGRGHRDSIVAERLCQLTGAEAACIVNNNAAAVLLVLATMAAGREVIVSRGELVEIGGAFRVPEVMSQAGCRLVEVGTTNRTHLHDYKNAVSEQTALLMKVHTSNYHIEGFTAEVSGQELAELGREYTIPSVIDLGSGALIDMTQWGLPEEPMPQRYLAQGIDIVTFSGDKLLGGPQAGIILGKKAWIEAIQRHPLKRALRADKMTLAALDATLRLYRHPEKLAQTLPSLRLLTRSADDIYDMAQRLVPKIQAYYGDEWVIRAEPCSSQIGSGSLPVERLPGWAVTFTPQNGKGSALATLTQSHRQLTIPVIGRVSDGRLWWDLRCLEDENRLLQALLP